MYFPNCILWHSLLSSNKSHASQPSSNAPSGVKLTTCRDFSGCCNEARCSDVGGELLIVRGGESFLMLTAARFWPSQLTSSSYSLGLWRWCYHLPCHAGVSPRIDPTRHQRTAWSEVGIHPPSELGWGPWMHNGTQWGTGTSKWRGALLIRLVRTQVQIHACPRKQKGRLTTSQWYTPVAAFFFGWNRASQVQGAGWKYCAVWEYVKMRAESQSSSEVSEEFPPTLCLSGSLVTGGDSWKSE
jgi:hypothetical protein